MSFRICVSCGRRMSDSDLENSSNPNVCATCLYLTFETDEIASAINASTAVNAADCRLGEWPCGASLVADEGDNSFSVRA